MYVHVSCIRHNIFLIYGMFLKICSIGLGVINSVNGKPSVADSIPTVATDVVHSRSALSL